METQKQSELEVGRNETRSPDTLMGHQWTGWPGAHCCRCGAGQVLEHAVGQGWIIFTENLDGSQGPNEWISEDHQELVRLCDGFCSSDMTQDEIKKNDKAIEDLCTKIGRGKDSKQGTVRSVSRPA
jgi:hypothetical protein